GARSRSTSRKPTRGTGPSNCTVWSWSSETPSGLGEPIGFAGSRRRPRHAVACGSRRNRSRGLLPLEVRREGLGVERLAGGVLGQRIPAERPSRFEDALLHERPDLFIAYIEGARRIRPVE